MKKLWILLLAALMIFTLTACKDDKKEPKGDPPTASDWSNAGLGTAFGGNVEGTLTTNTVEENVIQMRWSGSNEAGLSDTVNWLQSNGFTSEGGIPAEVETLPNGMKCYTAEKTTEDGVMTAEVVFFTQDVTIEGQTFRAGELIFTVSPSETPTPPPASGTVAAWPATQIEAALGISIPEYTGTAGDCIFSDASFGELKSISVLVCGAAEGADTAYRASLSQNGYAPSDDLYVKTFANGDRAEIFVYYGQTMHPSTYQSVNALQITVTYHKGSGNYTAWSGLDLSHFNGAGLPAFSGGTSFDLTDISEAAQNEQTAALQQAIDILARYEHMLDEEQKAELAALRAQLPYIEQINAVTITVYGTNDEQIAAYQSALESAGFAYGEKDAADFRYSADVSTLDEGRKAIIYFTKVPLALFDNGGGTEETTPAYTMPENVKIVYTYGLAGSTAYTYTVIKVGEDYYKQELASGIIMEEVFYKKKGNAWEVYRRDYSEEAWSLDSEQASERSYIEREVFDFIVTEARVADYDDTVKGEQAMVAGRTTDVYTQYENTVYHRDTETGLILKHSISSGGYTLDYTVTVFDATVNSFDGITLPQ